MEIENIGRKDERISGLKIVILIVTLYQFYWLLVNFLPNGLFVFNIENNDSGIFNIFLLIYLLFSTIYLYILFYKTEYKIKFLNNLYFGLSLLVYSMPFITYYLDFPSNDYMRVGGIFIIPIILFGWIFSIHYLKKKNKW